MFNTPWHTNLSQTITNAYGTTEFGGISNKGTVFEVGLTGGVTTLYTFTNLNGAYPCSQLAVSGSTFYGIPNALYGTTLGGGSNGYGTVFKLNADGSGFADLYEFAGTNDGKFPRNGLLIDGNMLYGTTSNSIFKISTSGNDFMCLTNVTNASQLILSLSGNTLYGTTTNGGTNNLGMVFSVSTSGTNFSDLHAFTGANGDGALPMSGLEILECSNAFWYGSTTGVLFGTTYGGGIHSNGMVFSINTDGSGFTDLHDFAGGASDGANPVAGLLLTNNNILWPDVHNLPTSTFLFGTTTAGGANSNGTIFGMSPDGSVFRNLYNFGGAATNAANPEGKLAFFGSTLYGVTAGGGVHTNGMVFSVNDDGTDLADLHDFGGAPNDGGAPSAGLALPVLDNPWSIWSLDTTLTLSGLAGKYEIAIDDSYALYVNGNFVSNTNTDYGAHWLPLAQMPYLHSGTNDIRVVIAGNGDNNDYFTMLVQGYPALPYVLYGTTSGGGANNDGTVFELGYSNDEVILHNFGDRLNDGTTPIGDLVLFSNTLYGVTENGGKNNNGTVFRINADGSGYTNLYSFGGPPDGSTPVAGLALTNNVLYGTTKQGGSNNIDGTTGWGSIFRINTDGSGYASLYGFDGQSHGDGGVPMAPLLLVSNILYGTASAGNGVNDRGTIFSIATDGSGYTDIYRFGSVGSDGGQPEAGLAASGAMLYGTTSSDGIDGNGTIFCIAMNGLDYTNLYNFGTNANDGLNPRAGLVFSGNRLYGTTYAGGTGSYGTIFGIGTDGNGFTNLLSFGASDSDFGQHPEADLIALSNSLYGTTYASGLNGRFGMVFSVNTNGVDFGDIYDFMGNPGGQPPDGASPEGGVSSP